MPSAPGDPAEPRRRRMAPDERREQIVAAARGLFAERPYGSVSTADVAEAAGVARSLVHRYFRGIREVFLAVAFQGASAVAGARVLGPETPFEERTARNVAASLDVVAANRETWLAVVGHGADGADPEIVRLIALGRERAMLQTLLANSDVLPDTPTARFAVRCSLQLSAEAIRQWLQGEQTREATEALLLTAGRDLIRHTIPALEGREPGG